MEKPTCETCVYWDHQAGEDVHEEAFCRRRAPQSVEYKVGSNIATYHYDWCGEHNDFSDWLEQRKPNE